MEEIRPKPCTELFDILPNMILLFDEKRRLSYLNQSALDFLQCKDAHDVLGKRPGDVLGCVNAAVPNASGCGTSRYCRYCALLDAITKACNGERISEECSLLRRTGSELVEFDLEARVAPIVIGDRPGILVSLHDITQDVRRRNMERIFFHDVLNLAGGINSLVEVLSGETGEMRREFEILHSATETLVEEILAQRELSEVENNEFVPMYSLVSPMELFEQLRKICSALPAAQGQTIVLEQTCPDLRVETDGRLARRVLGNMLKNAVEAGRPGDRVSLSCREDGGDVLLSVQNSAVLPVEARNSIFRRRFSTKGASRGMGTYSMLLLSERYLHGRVSFASENSSGTTFSLRLPKRREKG